MLQLLSSKHNAMKKKNKGRKSLTAMGAVVAAGLTPGIASSTPASPPTSTDVELTAADAVAINGNVFDFDELFAMRQINRDQRNPPKVYGPPPSIRNKEREDSITQTISEVYGPPPPMEYNIGPEELRSMAALNKQGAIDLVLEKLLDFCSKMPNPDAKKPIRLSENRDIIRELEMGPSQLQMLQEEIENSFGVLVAEDMLKQLSTLHRIADFIVTVVSPIKKD